MTTPRVLHVVQSGDRGGVQRHVRDLAVGLAPRTAGVIVGSGGWLADALSGAGIRTDVVTSLRRSVNPTAVLLAGRDVAGAAASLGAGVVHAHGIFALLAALSVRSLPIVYTAHGFQWRDPAHRPWLRALSRQLHRQITPRLAAFIAVSRQDAEDATALGVDPRRIHRVPNGVEVPPLVEAERRPRVLGTAGRLVPGKNVAGILELLAMLPTDVALWVAGEGHALARPPQATTPPSLAHRVQWLGWRDDMDAFYRGIGVYVTMSRKEGMPYAVLDAMAYGCPTVASDIPAHRELLGGKPWGVLVPDGKLTAGVERVLSWLADPQQHRQASAAARREVLQRFSLAAMLDLTATVYHAAHTQAVATGSMTN